MTITTTPRLSASAAHSEEMIERARHLRAEADRLELEAAFSRGEEFMPSTRWHDVMRDGWANFVTTGSPTPSDLAAHAVVCALRGESGRAHQLAAEVACAAPSDSGLSIGTSLARAIAWMGDGDCAAAYEILASQFARHRHATAAQYVIALTGVFAEAAARTGQLPKARAVLAQWRPLFSARPPQECSEFVLASLILYDAEPSLDDGEAGAVRPPLMVARLQLARGMSIRRHRRTRESRPHLTIAADLLAQVGARPWLALATSELRAAGVRQAGTAPSGELSPQEQTIAQLAAGGLSNREIGERLYLSPRTVGSHLYRIFPKLGITSRHQLARSL